MIYSAIIHVEKKSQFSVFQANIANLHSLHKNLAPTKWSQIVANCAPKFILKLICKLPLIGANLEYKVIENTEMIITQGHLNSIV